jgi:hypothetical protein
MSIISPQHILNIRLEHLAPNESLCCMNALGLKELEVSRSGLVIHNLFVKSKVESRGGVFAMHLDNFTFVKIDEPSKFFEAFKSAYPAFFSGNDKWLRIQKQ